MKIGSIYIEIETGEEWKLIDFDYFDVTLENVDMTYIVAVEDFGTEFRLK